MCVSTAPGSIDVDADAVLAEHRAQGLAQHADGALGAAIGDLGRRADMRRDRADHDDGAAMALGDHLPRAFGADHPGAADVGLEQIVEILDRGRRPRS
jgi:hypothetical protein